VTEIGRSELMNETVVTMVGNVASAITDRRMDDGTVMATFRVASTERRMDRTTSAWVDGDSLYVSVTCWRRLAENVIASLVVGDPVVVTGRLHTRSFETDGQRRSTISIAGQSVAPDLARCTAAITRNPRRGATAAPAAEVAGVAEDVEGVAGGNVPATEQPRTGSDVTGDTVVVASSGPLVAEGAGVPAGGERGSAPVRTDALAVGAPAGGS
jgi:single-strand DNA-binding protein